MSYGYTRREEKSATMIALVTVRVSCGIIVASSQQIPSVTLWVCVCVVSRVNSILAGLAGLLYCRTMGSPLRSIIYQCVPIVQSTACSTTLPPQHLRPSGLFSCRPHSLELSPGFHPGTDSRCRLLQSFT